MIDYDVQAFITDLLRLFFLSTGLAGTYYEINEKGEAKEIARSEDGFFPKYCHAIWDLQQGAARRTCDKDMCVRAAQALMSRRNETMCHAGLVSFSQPIAVYGRIIGVIQYGGVVSGDETRKAEQLARHALAMQTLEASPSEAEHLQALLVNPARTFSRAQIDLLQHIARSLSTVTAQFIRQRRIREGANHDLQIRLQAALAMADNLLTGLETASPYYKSVEGIVSAIEAAADAMHGSTSGRYLPQDYRFTQQPIAEFINHAYDLCRPEAEKKGVRVIIDLQPRQGNVILQASKAHLQTAFDNILQNAVKYSYRSTLNSDTRHIQVKGHLLHSGYEITIENYGVGIEPDELERIFEEGYRGRLTQGEYRTGGGQGLALAKQAITKHHGRVTATSDPAGEADDGTRPYVTRFSIWLPLKQPEERGVE
jgi:signal transduction histidine kinase